MDTGLSERLFDFTVNIIKACRNLPSTQEYKIIANQLIRSASSSGANYEEAQGANSKADFFNKINISLKEMRESNYWLRVLIKINNDSEVLQKLSAESIELKKILGAINSKSVKRNT